MSPLLLLLAAAGDAPIAVPEVDDLEVIAVVDNTYDCFQPDERCAVRHSLAHVDGFDAIRLTAEMGLAFLIRYHVGGRRHVLLFDFGLTERALVNNLEKLGLGLADVEALVLSHEDHYAGLAWAAARTRAPLYVGNGDAFLERRFETPKRAWSMGTLDRAALVARGLQIVEVPAPRVIAGGALLSGAIPQRAPFESVPPFLKMIKDGKSVPDPMTHELAIGLRVRGRGLVVITACAHAGVINSVEALRAASGEKRVHAVLGGMHLTSAPEPQVERTVAALTALEPDHLAPMHCTGDRAIRRLAAAMPGAFVAPSAGTTYRFAAP